MKRIDKQTERRLYWLFTPMAIVVVALILELAAIKQKCWGELAVAMIILIVTLINMGNFFVDLLMHEL